MKSKVLSVAIIATLCTSLGAYAAAPANTGAAARAQAMLAANPSASQRNAGDDFAVQDVMVDADGTEHVRMERQYRGLPVIGGDIVVHSRNGALKSVSKHLKSALRPNTNSRIRSDDALVAAGMAFGTRIDSVPTLRKVVYARNVEPTLAWEVRLQGIHATGTPLDLTYFVDADNGKLLMGVSNIHFAKGGKTSPTSGGSTTPPVSTTPGVAAVGTGRSLWNGSVVLNTTTGTSGFVLTDATRNNSVTRNANGGDLTEASTISTPFEDADNIWGNSTKRDDASAASDAHYGVAASWDYYQQVFGRLGIRNDGAATTTFVNVGGRNLGNAYWYGGAMYFGGANRAYNSMVSLDIVGHEMSHGVTQATAGLVYSGESGGLNESTSDIFGTMVEYFANNANDVPDYTIAERVSTSTPMRYMYKPSLDGSSADCYSAAVMSMDPHYSSGVGNHFFYLLAEGAVAPANTGLSPAQLVCNGNTGLRGIGRDAAQRIWYQALTRYMTSGTNYADARAATLQATVDLFGAGSIQQQAVAAAWGAVNVN